MLVITLATVIGLISGASGQSPVFKDDASDKVTWKFKDRPKLDVSKVLLEWEPFNMIEDISGVDKEGGLGVSIKSGDGEFVPWTERPKVRAGRFTYTLPITPCLDTSFQFYAKNAEGITYYEFPDVIPASSAEAIADSSFQLEPPGSPRIDQSGGSVAVYWEPSVCADRYDVSFYGSNKEEIHRNITGDKWEEAGLAPCSEYDVMIVSVIHNTKYSEEVDVDQVLTPPDSGAGANLVPEITASQHGVEAKWDGYSVLSCVNKYQVTLCNNDECPHSSEVNLDNSLSYVGYTSEQDLEQCTDYELRIKPLHSSRDIQEKVVSFRTLSPAMDDVASQLGPVTAASKTGQTVSVSWTGIKCAQEYQVYQQMVASSGETEEWELVREGETGTEISFTGVPCTEYRYGVRAVIDGAESDISVSEETVVTPLEGEVFTPSNLDMKADTESVALSWDHAGCIHQYRVRVCYGQGECQEEDVVMEGETSHAHVTIGSLQPCTEYKVQIFASTGDQELGAETSRFSTQAPEPAAPENFNLDLNDKKTGVSLSFAPVTCARLYRVYSTGEGEEELLRETSDTSVDIDSIEPCSDLSLAVAAVVAGEEGPRTQALAARIPPRNGDRSKPRLHIDEKFNKTVVFSLSAPDFNSRCEVESYHVQYHNLGGDSAEKLEATIPASEINEGKIVLDNFPGEVDQGMKVEGRIKYLGFESWSPWISSHSQKPEIVVGDGNGIIVPIVIGALIAVVVLIVLIFFIVRRKKTQNKYDCDVSDKSENKKLNDQEEA